MKRILIFLLLIPSFCNAGIFYASPTGTGTGSKVDPFGLQTAIGSPRNPGDTIYLLAGTYTGCYTSNLTGTIIAPILLRNNPGDRVVIDGTKAGQAIKSIPALKINGVYTIYQGLEITNSDPVRTGAFSGNDSRGTGVEVFGVGVKIINCIIYDAGNGLAAWSASTNSEFYGNIIFNNGWNSSGGLTGHGIYSQNNTGTKFFSDNIILNSFGYGLHVYGSDQAQLNNFTFEGNVCFNDLWLMGGATPLKNAKLVSNYSYKDFVDLGYQNTANDTLTLTNNFFPFGMHIKWFKNITATGNTIFRYTNPAYPIGLSFEGPPNVTTWKFNNNIYYWSTSSPTSQQYFFWRNTIISNPDAPGGAGNIFLPEWKTRGQDSNSTFKLFPLVGGALVLSGKNVFVRKNKYDQNRSNVIIYNWDKSATVNISSGLSVGDSFELRNVQNYFGDVIKGVATGDSLIVPMTGHTVAKPIGYTTEIAPSTFPEFGVFVLIRKAAPLQVNPCHNIDSLINLVSIMQGQIIGLQHSIDSIGASSTSGINNLNTRISALESQVEGNLNTQITALQTALTALQTKVSNLKAITTIQ